MSTAAGTATLARLVLRRDRVRVAVWVLALGLLATFSATSIQDLYATRDELARYAATVRTNQAVVAMSGPPRALDTYGGRIAFEIWQFSAAIALMAVFAVGRHTRAEEEAGRAELVGAAPVGRHARSLAAVAVSALSSLAVGVVVGAGLLAVGLPVRGSLAMGASFATTGFVFAGVALLTAQLAEHARTGTGLAAAVVGLAYVVRAVGDAGSGALSWASPLGWMQATHPYSGDRWWPLGLSVMAAAGLVAVALAVEARRDVGAGLVRPRPGRPTASLVLTRPVGLAWRLQRSGLAGWAVGILLGGAAMGSVADSADDLVGDNQGIRDFLAQLGGASLADAFLATVLVYLALLAAGFAVAAVLRVHTEEQAGRAEPVLATATSRGAWLGGHVSVALGGSLLLLASAGLGVGLAYGIAVGDPVQVPRLVAAALAFAPAVWSVAGVAVALTGLAPRMVAGAWAVLGLAVVVGALGEGLRLPAALRDLSPLTHVPGVPAVGVEILPLAVLTIAAAAAVAAGFVGIARRDVG